MNDRLAEALHGKEERILEVFRSFHRHPELSLREFQTTEKIKAILEELDIGILDIGMETGVVGLLKGAKEGPVIGLRADIDGLPIQEESTSSYPSENAGVMHACGHDTHMSALLGAAMVLSELRDSLEGSVKFIFQPAEEINQGAKMMDARNVLENPKVDMIFGVHNQPEIPAGKVGIKLGGLMAAVDTIRISIRGRGGHGGVPQNTIDPIVTTAAIINSLQSIVSRNVDPKKACVISLGSIHGGDANNVIPELVKLTGTVRTFDPEIGERIEGLMRRVIANTAAAYGTTAVLEYIYDLAAVFNPEALYKVALEAAEDIFPGCVVDPVPSTGGEDFSVFMKKVPGFLFWTGSGNQNNDCIYPWHSPHFKADERCVTTGAGMFASCVFHGIRAFQENRI